MTVLEAQLTATGPGASAPEEAGTRALRRGDPAAFEALVLEHQDRVYDFCVRMLGDREEALEVVQEIFVSVHQALPNFRFDSKVSTWIYRIGKNHCLNRLKYLQRRGRGRSDGLEGVPEEVLLDAAGAPLRPDEALQVEHERARVQRAISRLEPDQRALVALRDIEGLSYEEVVEVTGLPLGTVKSRLHRAREKLSEYLSDDVLDGERG